MACGWTGDHALRTERAFRRWRLLELAVAVGKLTALLFVRHWHSGLVAWLWLLRLRRFFLLGLARLRSPRLLDGFGLARLDGLRLLKELFRQRIQLFL